MSAEESTNKCSTSRNFILSTDIDDDMHGNPAPKLVFNSSYYEKKSTITSVCKEHDTIGILKACLNVAEQKWFSNHVQFKHIWHMPCHINHMLQGLWMLFLRMACIKDSEICLFVVNGVGIRYSIWEHGLISGLFCHSMDSNFEQSGSLDFVQNIFGKDIGKKKTKKKKELTVEDVTVQDVRQKLLSIAAPPPPENSLDELSLKVSDDRLKLGVLLFLSTVIDCSRVYGKINPFTLRIVNDLDFCERFPWGTFTFQACIKQLKAMEKNFGSVPNNSWTFSGFIMPLEVLAFEAIEVLKGKFRERVPAKSNCPRMCKYTWDEVKNGFRGFELKTITKELGETKDIATILKPDEFEYQLMDLIMDKDEIDKNKKILRRYEEQNICWPDLYQLDVKSRGQKQQDRGPEQEVNVSKLQNDLEELRKATDKRLEELTAKCEARDIVIAGLQKDVEALRRVSEKQRNGNHSEVLPSPKMSDAIETTEYWAQEEPETGRSLMLSTETFDLYRSVLLKKVLQSQKKCYIFGSYFYPKLIMPDTVLTKLRRWWKNTDLFSMSYIFIPICEEGHWSLVVVCIQDQDQDLKCEEEVVILHLDSSVGSHQKESIVDNVKRFLTEEWNYQQENNTSSVEDTTVRDPPLKLTNPDIECPQQTNMVDCGFFVLLFAILVIEEAPPRITNNTFETISEMISKMKVTANEVDALKKEIDNLERLDKKSKEDKEDVDEEDQEEEEDVYEEDKKEKDVEEEDKEADATRSDKRMTRKEEATELNEKVQDSPPKDEGNVQCNVYKSSSLQRNIPKRYSPDPPTGKVTGKVDKANEMKSKRKVTFVDNNPKLPDMSKGGKELGRKKKRRKKHVENNVQVFLEIKL